MGQGKTVGIRRGRAAVTGTKAFETTARFRWAGRSASRVNREPEDLPIDET